MHSSHYLNEGPKPEKEGDDYVYLEAAIKTPKLLIVSCRFMCCFIPLSMPRSRREPCAGNQERGQE